jgi:hypothetical protein
MPLHEVKLTMRAATFLGRPAARQAEIWAKVREEQEQLSCSIGAPVAASPSSLQLSPLEHERCMGCGNFLARTNKLLACANNFWALDFTSKLAMWPSPKDPTIWPLHRAQQSSTARRGCSDEHWCIKSRAVALANLPDRARCRPLRQREPDELTDQKKTMNYTRLAAVAALLMFVNSPAHAANIRTHAAVGLLR